MTLSLPTSFLNWRMASRNGRLSMSPTVPPTSTMTTSTSPETRWMAALISSVMCGITCTVRPRESPRRSFWITEKETLTAVTKMNFGPTSSLLPAQEVLHEFHLTVAVRHPPIETRVTEGAQRLGHARSGRNADSDDVIAAERRPGRPRGRDEPLDVPARHPTREPRRQDLEVAESPEGPRAITGPRPVRSRRHRPSERTLDAGSRLARDRETVERRPGDRRRLTAQHHDRRHLDRGRCHAVGVTPRQRRGQMPRAVGGGLREAIVSGEQPDHARAGQMSNGHVR